MSEAVTELRLRSKISQEALKPMLGKIVTESEIDVMLVGPSKVLLPDGRLLCRYIPGAFTPT